MIFMPHAGDELTITFTSQAPLAWGTHRRNHTRVRRSIVIVAMGWELIFLM